MTKKTENSEEKQATEVRTTGQTIPFLESDKKSGVIAFQAPALPNFNYFSIVEGSLAEVKKPGSGWDGQTLCTFNIESAKMPVRTTIEQVNRQLEIDEIAKKDWYVDLKGHAVKKPKKGTIYRYNPKLQLRMPKVGGNTTFSFRVAPN